MSVLLITTRSYCLIIAPTILRLRILFVQKIFFLEHIPFVWTDLQMYFFLPCSNCEPFICHCFIRLCCSYISYSYYKNCFNWTLNNTFYSFCKTSVSEWCKNLVHSVASLLTQRLSVRIPRMLGAFDSYPYWLRKVGSLSGHSGFFQQ